MFNFGITEIMVIAVIGLVVIGPERLPKVARTLGHMFSRMQRYVSDVKSDISKEMQLEELKSLQKSMQETASEIQDSVSEQVNFIETEVEGVDKSVQKTVESELGDSNEQPLSASKKDELNPEQLGDASPNKADAAEVLDEASDEASSEFDKTKTGGIDLVGGLGFGSKREEVVSDEAVQHEEAQSIEVKKNSEVS